MSGHPARRAVRPGRLAIGSALFVLVAAPGTPAQIVARLDDEALEALADPVTRDRGSSAR